MADIHYTNVRIFDGGGRLDRARGFSLGEID